MHGELRIIYRAIERENGPLADSRRITQFPCPNLSENPRVSVSPLENGTCKVDARVHDESALSQFYGFDADFAAFSSNFSSSFYGGEI
jgi:hypothetical protein